MKPLLLIALLFPCVGLFGQEGKQYVVYEIGQKKGQSLTVMAVNMFNVKDTAKIIYGWRGLGKPDIKQGTILTVHTKGIGRRKTIVILNH